MGAHSVLSRLTAESQAGLLSGAFFGWLEELQAEKDSAEMEQVLNQKSAQLNGFASKNKGAAMNATQKKAQIEEQNLLIPIFCLWKREAKVERMRRFGKEKNLKRKQELQGVKGLFKNFASELEENLKEGTPRVEVTAKGN